MVLLFEAHNGNLLGLAQMVERPLSMREVRGSTPEFSAFIFFIITFFALSQSKKILPFRSEFAVYYFVLPLLAAPMAHW